MTNTFTLEIELPRSEDLIEIEVTTEGNWENDGIGAYEYWGCKGVDRGTTFFGIDTWQWDTTGFSPDEIKLVESAIEASLNKWAETVKPDAPDYDDSEPDEDCPD